MSATPPAARPFWPFLLALAAVAGLAELALVIVNVSALPVYLEYGLGLGHLVGFSLGSFYLAEALGNLPMGTLGDRLGRRRLMMTGTLVSVGTCIGTALIGSAYVRLTHGEAGGVFGILGPGLLLFMRVLDGLGAAALWPTLFASVGDRVPADRQAQAMSALNITYFVGIAFGPFVGGIVNDTFSNHLPKNDPARYVPSFFLAAACFGTAAIVAYFVAPRRGESHLQEDPRNTAIHEREALGEAGAAASHDPHESTFSLVSLRTALRRVPALMGLAFLTFLAIGLIAPYIKLFAMERYLHDVPETDRETVFGTLLLAPALLVAALAIPLGHLTDRWGKSRSIIGGMGICALSLWVMLLIPSKWAVVTLGSLMGIGFVLAFPAYMAYIADVAGAHERGGMIGAVRMTQGIGALVGTMLSAPLFKIDRHHLTLFIVAGALLTLGFLLSLLYVRERPAEPH